MMPRRFHSCAFCAPHPKIYRILILLESTPGETNVENIFYSSVLIAVTRLTTDQRGAPRPVGVRCDVGAFEYSPPRYLYLPLIVR